MNFQPPAPARPTKPLGFMGFVLTMARNPLAIWGVGAFREPIITTEWLGVPTVIISDPGAIRHVLVDNAKNYGMQPLRQRVLRPILRDGLLTAEGELWRRTRKSLASIFSPRNVAPLGDVMLKRSQQFADGLAGHSGEVVDVAEQMTLLTFDILQATLFSGDLAGEPKSFATAANNLLKTMGRVDPMDVLDAPAFVPRLTRVQGARSLRYFRRLIADTIARRRAVLDASPEAAPRDLLTLLLEAEGLSRSEVEDNIITFIGAGHETTARALGWSLYLLSQAPEVRERLETEIDAHNFGDSDPYSWPDKLPMTRAVLEEAMRLYPPAPSLNRQALDDDEVDGVKIAKGATVLVMPWILHRHQKLWDRPDAFVPERFLPGARESIERYQYLPFGAGPRVCIGQYFAMQEAVVALACLCRRLRYEFAADEPPHPVQKITVQPEGGLKMRVVRR